MKLSIIIPVYNEYQFIRRCLDSVCVNEEVEVIIVDDGSTDGTLDIYPEYTDKGFKLIQNEHSGVSVARNTGIHEAEGEYVTFLDSDDYIVPGGITSILNVLENHTDPIIQFNHSRTKYFNSEGNYSLLKLPRKWVLVWNKVYNREFILDHGIEFPAGVPFEEDRIFNLKCFNYCTSIYNSATVTVNKCFDNDDSICHTVTKSKILASSNALVELISDQDTTKDVQRLIRKCLVELWDSKNAKTLFGK